MSEFIANERRHWKAMLFPYDVFIPDESDECQYCLTEKQAEYLRGLLEPAGWATRWWSDETPIDQDKIEQFRDDLIRRLMMSCCGGDFGIIFRWTEDGVLQSSDDGGETWTDDPTEDPRNSSPTFPPMAGSDGDDKKCLAATGMVALIKEQVGDQLTDDMSRYTLGQLITDWVTTLIQSSNPFQALLTIAANQIFALVISVLRAALTDTVYDLLLCIFYCHMEDNATFTQEDIDLIRSDIGDQIGGVATLFLQQLIFLLGPIGMTNLARAGGATTGDCSSCDCNCFGEDCVGGWSVRFGTPLAASGCNLKGGAAADGPHWTVSFGNNSTTACKVTTIGFSEIDPGVVTWQYYDAVGAGPFLVSSPVGYTVTDLVCIGSNPGYWVSVDFTTP
jgi:hypothetical protein